MRNFTNTLLMLGFCVVNSHLFSQQVFVNNGANVRITPGGLVSIFGGYTNQNNGMNFNSGEIYVTGNWENLAQNGALDPTDGDVILFGNNQTIQGVTPTDFHNLILTGGGVKSQTVDANVHNQLILNDRELNTNTNTMFVLNPDLNAITRTTGFVSSLGNGSLSRVTNQIGVYLYPTGSSINPPRYQPIEITPNDNAQNSYTVRFVNNDPNIDNLSRQNLSTEVCEVTPAFYHKINRSTGNTPADIKIFYNQAEIGLWNSIAKWQNNEWGLTSPNVLAPGNPNSVTVFQFNNFNEDPYILANNRPEAPEISGPTDFCEDNLFATYQTPPNPNLTFQWSVQNGNIVNTSPDQSSVNVLWSFPGGTITVFVTDPLTGCTSNLAAGSITSVVNPSPTAIFTVNPPTGINAGDPVTLIDNSFGATNWLWFLPNGNTAIGNLVDTNFPKEGENFVTLVVENEFGCTDTARMLVLVNPAADIYIPSAFTPNTDSKNEIFKVYGPLMKRFEMRIFNRWGEEIFYTNNQQEGWNGRYKNFGEAVPIGAYVYKVSYTNSSNKTKEVTGSVIVLR